MEVEHPEDVRASCDNPNEQGHKLLATNIVKHLQQGIPNEYTNKKLNVGLVTLYTESTERAYRKKLKEIKKKIPHIQVRNNEYNNWHGWQRTRSQRSRL